MSMPFNVTCGPDADGIVYIMYPDPNMPSKVAMETYQDGDMIDRGDAGQCLEAESPYDPENGNMTALFLAAMKYFQDPQGR
jgi:hypothetical protein